MLHEFLSTNRTELIDRCRAKVAKRPAPKATDAELEYGVPVLIDQLIKAVQLEQPSDPSDPKQSRQGSGDSDSSSTKKASRTEIGKTAQLHGRELLEQDFTVDRVVHDYCDLRQAVTELAFKVGTPIKVGEYLTLNRCLDDAIAGAVTEFSERHDSSMTDQCAHDLNERLACFAHELRNLLQTTTLAVSVIKAGTVGITGEIGAILDRSLIGLRNLIDHTLADARTNAGMPARFQRMSLANFISEVKVSASLDAQAKKCKFTVAEVNKGLAVEADRDMLFSAVGNLLQNAFKFTHDHSEVSLTAYAAGDRIRIDIEDHCGGLPPGILEKLFQPFTQSNEDKSGSGLGLSIARRSIEANNGVLSVRDVPGSGCVFTIDLPRHSLQ